MNKSWKDAHIQCIMSLHHNNNFYNIKWDKDRTWHTQDSGNEMRGNGNWVFDTNYFDIFGWCHTPIIIYRYDSDNHFWCVRCGRQEKGHVKTSVYHFKSCHKRKTVHIYEEVKKVKLYCGKVWPHFLIEILLMIIRKKKRRK